VPVTDSGETPPQGQGALFATTHWSVIVAASRSDSAAQDHALATLCRSYWPPVYAYIRRRGHKPEDAQDLTQEFFSRLLAKEWLAGIEPQISRFRSFLMTAVSRFLANEYDRSMAAKRGGGVLPLNLEHAEAVCRGPWTSPESPERAYDRRWALAVLDQALNRLREETTASGKTQQFERLERFLSREADDGEYAALAREWGMSAGAVGVGVHRLRQRYREWVRTEIAATLSDPGLVEEEMRHLLTVLQNEGS
jgi:RNA polymerase sigma-70 factor (ECF subfamily)